MEEVKLYDKVYITRLDKDAVVVWIDEEPGHDSYLLEHSDTQEIHFYERKDFKKLSDE